MNTPLHNLSAEGLAKLGMPNMVYIRTTTAAELAEQVEELPDIPGDTLLYSVHAADGTRMAVMDNREAALLAIRQHEMEPVSVH